MTTNTYNLDNKEGISAITITSAAISFLFSFFQRISEHGNTVQRDQREHFFPNSSWNWKTKGAWKHCTEERDQKGIPWSYTRNILLAPLQQFDTSAIPLTLSLEYKLNILFSIASFYLFSLFFQYQRTRFSRNYDANFRIYQMHELWFMCNK